MTQIRNSPRGTRWQYQHERMIRFFRLFEHIDRGDQVGASFEGQEDEMLSFFMNCYHLKDWIKNDFNDEQLSTAIEAFINRTECLQLCADICNGAKHLSLRKPRLGEPTAMRTEVHIDEASQIPRVQRRWYVQSESGRIFDVFEVAKECVQVWSDFLRDNEERFSTLKSG